MANVLIDSWDFYNDPITYQIFLKVYYDAVTDKFTVNQISSYSSGQGSMDNLQTLEVWQRKKSDNQEISASCSGFNRISFQATLTKPFVKRVIIPNSTDCGYVEPAPAPVCDLVVTPSSEQPSGVGLSDGTITSEWTTGNTGDIIIRVYSLDNVLLRNVITPISSLSYTFTGLPSGSYRLFSGLAFGCSVINIVSIPEADTPPPPTCDLVVSVTSTRVSAIGVTDGTITANLSTVNTGDAIVELFKNGVLIDNETIDLSVITSVVFSGLADQEYTVTANLVDYTCQSAKIIEVLPPAALVCDLILTTTSESLTGLNSKDGAVTANYSTENTGSIVLRLLKDGYIVNNVIVSPDTTEYSFTGLESGSYQVSASLSLFACVKKSDITVAPMSFNEKYFFEFCESKFDNRPVKISLKKKNYSGATTKINLAQANVLNINHESESEYKFEPIFGSSCDINLITEQEFQFADLFITEEQDTLAEIFIDDELFWTGYLTGDRATEDFKHPPYQISLNALDGIKLLKDIEFDVRDKYISFLEAIKYILDKTNLSLPFKTMVDIKDKTLSVDYKLLAGFDINVNGNQVDISGGVAVINGVSFDLTGNTFTIPDLPSAIYERKYYILSSNTFPYLSTTLDTTKLIIATITQRAVEGVKAERTRYWNGDTLNDHLFNTNVFVKDEENSTNCTEALEFICRQFTCQVKQSGGYWVIENIGSKARLNTTEYTYDKDLNLISSEVVDLVKDIDCSQDINKVLSGANISLIPGDKKATVHWKLGYPKPIFGNWNFEQWFIKNGAEIPAQWQITEPYGWFNKGSKFDRIYDPVTGEITEVENGSYYFNIKRGSSGLSAFQSTNIIVFNQEVINFSFQLIITNKLPNYSAGRYIVGIKPKIGNYICANSRVGEPDFDPIWVIDDGRYSFEFTIDFDDTKFLPFGDETNVNLTFPAAPLQGLFNIKGQVGFITSNVSGVGSAGLVLSDIGFDNFKVTKTSPVTNVKTIEDATITVINGNKFSNVPDDFEVVMGDVETNLRTDGIRTLNQNVTQLWRREGVEENEALNNIICKELLSQYQVNTRIFEGDILGKEITVRNIFNLPTLDLFRFIPISFDYDVINCIASVTLVEVYAEDGASSGSIGGGSGGSPNIVPLGYILASKNNIFTDGNDNLFSSE